MAATAAALGAYAAPALAAADDWQNAETLTPNVRLVTAAGGFDTQDGEPFTLDGPGWCQQNVLMEHTMWWTVVGTGGDITLSTQFSANGTSPTDTLLAVYAANVTTPTEDNALGCWDDNDGDDATVTVTNTIKGAKYLVQTGTCGHFHNGAELVECQNGEGSINLSAVTNDERAFAAPAVGGPLTNGAASLETGEHSTCNGKSYGSTVWFRYLVREPGTLSFSAVRFDTVLALYRGGATTPLQCSDGTVASDPLAEKLSRYLQPGEYFIQVGGKALTGGGFAEDNFSFDIRFDVDLDLDDDGSLRPDDCNDRNPAINPRRDDVPHNGVDEDCRGGDDKDADDDGHIADFAGGDDCDDNNLNINPNVADKPNNGVDEDCKNGDKPARLPTSPQVSFVNDVAPGGRIFGTMRVRNLRKGYTVRVKCRGSGDCPRKIKRKIRKGSSATFPVYAGRILGRGTRVDIRITTKGNVLGFLKRYTVRGQGNPKQTVCDMRPGSGALLRCRAG